MKKSIPLLALMLMFTLLLLLLLVLPERIFAQQVRPAQQAQQKVLTIPYSHQWRTYSCGQNSFRMIMGYWGERLEKCEIFLHTGFNSTYSKMFADIIEHNYPDFRFEEIDKSIAGVIEAIDRDRPVMIETISSELSYLDYGAAAGHYIVAVGYNKERDVIYLRDPNSYYIEALKYEELERAWDRPDLGLFVIYRQDGRPVPPEEIEHFSPEAKLFGAEKEDHALPFLTAFIPTIYTVLHTSENGIANTNLLDDWLYTVKLHGLYFGHLNLERSPWIYQDDPFYGLAANFGFDFGNMTPLFNNSDNASPGVFRFLRAKTLDIRSFNTIKRIPALTLPVPIVEVMGYMSLLDPPYTLPPVTATGDSPLFRDLRGGRISFRYGLDQVWGYAGAGVSLTSVYVRRLTYGNRILVPGLDITCGPLEGALQFCNATFENGIGIHVDAFSLALDFNLPRLSGGILSVLDFLGFFRSSYRFSYERFRYYTPNAELKSVSMANRFEFPMSLKYLDLIYGFDIESDLLAIEPAQLTIGGRLLFNQLLPYFQAQVGYKFSWRGTGAGDTNHALHVGIHAGLW